MGKSESVEALTRSQPTRLSAPTTGRHCDHHHHRHTVTSMRRMARPIVPTHSSKIAGNWAEDSAGKLELFTITEGQMTEIINTMAARHRELSSHLKIRFTPIDRPTS